MLKINLLLVDRTRSPFIREGEAFYLDRIGKYARIRYLEVKPFPARKGVSKEQVLAQESKSLIRHLAPQDYLIALDVAGKVFSSEQLASRLQILSQSHNPLTFAIGGHLGLSSTLQEKASEIWSLSRLTFTHEMSRLIFLEQLFRAFTILSGEPYHKT